MKFQDRSHEEEHDSTCVRQAAVSPGRVFKHRTQGETARLKSSASWIVGTTPLLLWGQHYQPPNIVSVSLKCTTTTFLVDSSIFRGIIKKMAHETIAGKNQSCPVFPLLNKVCYTITTMAQYFK